MHITGMIQKKKYHHKTSWS